MLGLQQTKNRKGSFKIWPNNSLKIFVLNLITISVVWQGLLLISEARVTHVAKGSLRLLKSSSSSLLHQSSGTHNRRFKRQTTDEYYDNLHDEDYDDNYEVVPLMPSDNPTTMGEHISEKAKEIAESFTKMWESIGESVKHCMDALNKLFSSDDGPIELTPEQEEQWRAAMEARRKAIEEQNEIKRRSYEYHL